MVNIKPDSRKVKKQDSKQISAGCILVHVSTRIIVDTAIKACGERRIGQTRSCDFETPHSLLPGLDGIHAGTGDLISEGGRL